MKKMVLIFFVVFSSENLLSQEYELKAHTVTLGETVKMISKQYKVRPSEIYRFNKFALEGISNGMILQIPVLKKQAGDESPKEPESTQEDIQTNGQINSTTNSSPGKLSKETLSSLTKPWDEQNG